MYIFLRFSLCAILSLFNIESSDDTLELRFEFLQSALFFAMSLGFEFRSFLCSRWSLQFLMMGKTIVFWSNSYYCFHLELCVPKSSSWLLRLVTKISLTFSFFCSVCCCYSIMNFGFNSCLFFLIAFSLRPSLWPMLL